MGASSPLAFVLVKDFSQKWGFFPFIILEKSEI